MTQPALLIEERPQRWNNFAVRLSYSEPGATVLSTEAAFTFALTDDQEERLSWYLESTFRTGQSRRRLPQTLKVCSGRSAAIYLIASLARILWLNEFETGSQEASKSLTSESRNRHRARDPGNYCGTITNRPIAVHARTFVRIPSLTLPESATRLHGKDDQ